MGGCFDIGALSDGRPVVFDDVDRSFDVEVGFAVAFITVGAFAFADVSSCTSVGAGVSAIANT